MIESLKKLKKKNCPQSENVMNKIMPDLSSIPSPNLISESLMKFKLPKPIYVTQPTMPRFQSFVGILKDIWETRWLTNSGRYHQELEERLSEYLGVKYCSLFCNGTLALLVGMRALKLTGEVITTPFSFPATANTLLWLNLTPVFADIEEDSFNLDPAKVEALITEKTSAILPVHVFGTPCRVDEIQSLADRYGLKVIYDAAHCMGMKLKGKSVVNWGDASILSFHATKLFTTLEGGALIVRDEKLKKEVDYLKNFGIADEETVLLPGINAKLNELQSAFGLLHLKMVDEEIAKRKNIALLYREKLGRIPGIKLPKEIPGVDHNYGYFPVLVEDEIFGMSRDTLYSCLRQFNVYARKYFFPLISTYSFFKTVPSAQPGGLPVAERIAKKILCLPIYGSLPHDYVSKICELLHFVYEHSEEFKDEILRSRNG